MHEIERPFFEEDNSKELCKTLLINFSGINNEWRLGMVTIESHVMHEFSRYFFKSCYILE